MVSNRTAEQTGVPRVLHIGKFYPPFAGGIENFMGDLLPALDTLGIHTGAVVHAHTRKPEHPRTTHQSIWRVPCWGNLLYTPISPAFPLWLSRAIRDFQPNILHLHMPNVSAFWTMAIPAARRIPWIIHWHSDVVSSTFDRRLAVAYKFYRPFEQMLLSRCSTVVATSPPYLATSPALRRWQNKSQIIPLGLDPARLPEPDNTLRAWAAKMWGKTDFKILAVGRLTYYKGHEILIKAMQGMKGAKLLIIGQGEQHDTLQKQISSQGVADIVSLSGPQPLNELMALIATCDCLCLPSIERTEAFGLVLLEAMRFGKPLVVSDIPGSGTGWVVEHDKNGLLVPPGKSDSLAAALSTMRNTPEARSRMGHTGLKRFKESFHINSVAEKTRDLYLTTCQTSLEKIL